MATHPIPGTRLTLSFQTNGSMRISALIEDEVTIERADLPAFVAAVIQRAGQTKMPLAAMQQLLHNMSVADRVALMEGFCDCGFKLRGEQCDRPGCEGPLFVEDAT